MKRSKRPKNTRRSSAEREGQESPLFEQQVLKLMKIGSCEENMSRISLCHSTSLRSGMESAAPGRVTEMADAWVARCMQA